MGRKKTARVPMGGVSTDAPKSSADQESAVKAVRGVFPELSADEATFLLIAHNFNVPATIAAHAAGDDAALDEWSSIDTKKPPGKKKKKKPIADSSGNADNVVSTKSTSQATSMKATSVTTTTSSTTSNKKPKPANNSSSNAKSAQNTSGNNVGKTSDLAKNQKNDQKNDQNKDSKSHPTQKPSKGSGMPQVDLAQLMGQMSTNTAAPIGIKNQVNVSSVNIATKPSHIDVRSRERQSLEERGISAAASGMRKIDLGQLMAQHSHQAVAPIGGITRPQSSSSSSSRTTTTTTITPSQPQRPSKTTSTTGRPSTSITAADKSTTPAVQQAVRTIRDLETAVDKQWEKARTDVLATFRRMQEELFARQAQLEQQMRETETKERDMLAARLTYLNTSISGPNVDVTSAAQSFDRTTKASAAWWNSTRTQINVEPLRACIKSVGCIRPLSTFPQQPQRQVETKDAQKSLPTATSSESNEAENSSDSTVLADDKPNKANVNNPPTDATKPKRQRTRKPNRARREGATAASTA